MASPAAPFLDPYRACVTAGSKVLGELCFSGGECATGVCCAGVCSACCDVHPCPEGRSCRPVAIQGAALSPFACDPGDGRGGSGEPCLAGADCASGSCDGGDELRVCLADGRRCAQDTDCPTDPEGQGDFGTCVLVGTAGGSCR
jgi:hypothetical protein